MVSLHGPTVERRGHFATAFYFPNFKPSISGICKNSSNALVSSLVLYCCLLVLGLPAVQSVIVQLPYD